MAIKGLSYLKTVWNFQERPVASNKLNTWDDRIENALELAYFLINHAFGGGNGVVQGATMDDLAVVAKASPALSVEVRPGYAFISGCPFKLAATTPTADVLPPDAQPRIDLVQAQLATWNVTIKTGTEAPSPSAPGPDAHCLPLAEIYCRPGMTAIYNTDDSINGYLSDRRVFL